MSRLQIKKKEAAAARKPAPGPTEPHVAVLQRSGWVARWLGEPMTGARLLDFACGSGRHSLLAASRGFRVLAVDRDAAALDRMESKNIEARAEDLESGRWSFSAERFQVVVVTNFLHRPRLDLLAGLLAPGGRLLYETFGAGNERHGKPSRPSFLLQQDELIMLARRSGLLILAFEQGFATHPKPAQVQRLAAIRPPHDPQSLPLTAS